MFALVFSWLFFASPSFANTGGLCASEIAFSQLRSELVLHNPTTEKVISTNFDSLQFFAKAERNFEVMASAVTAIKLWNSLTSRDLHALLSRVSYYVDFLSDTEDFFTAFEEKLTHFTTDSQAHLSMYKGEIQLARHEIAEWQLKIVELNKTIEKKGDSVFARLFYSNTLSRANEEVTQLTSNISHREAHLKEFEIKVESLKQKVNQLKALQIIYGALKADDFKALKSHPIFQFSEDHAKAGTLQTKALLTYFLLLDFATEKKQISEAELEDLKNFMPYLYAVEEPQEVIVPKSVPSYFLRPKTVEEIRHLFWALSQENFKIFDFKDPHHFVTAILPLKQGTRSLEEREYAKTYFESFFKSFDSSLFSHLEGLVERGIWARQHVIAVLVVKAKAEQKIQLTPRRTVQVTQKSFAQMRELSEEVAELEVLQRWIKRIRRNEMSIPSSKPDSADISSSDKEWYQIIDFLSLKYRPLASF